MRRLILRLLKPMLGDRRLQWLFEHLQLISLAGMNVGRGADTATSGERWVLETLHRSYGPLVVVDVGANHGRYARLVLEASPGAAVYSLEPSAAAFEILRRSASDVPRWEAFNLGLSNTQGELVLYGDEPGSELSSLYPRNLGPGKPAMEAIERVSIDSLDGFCKRHSIGAIDLLKLDAEGHELLILHGASELLRNGSIRAIQFEFGGCDLDSDTTLRDFFDLLSPGYEIFRILRNGLRPVVYSERWEIFMTTNFLAISSSEPPSAIPVA